MFILDGTSFILPGSAEGALRVAEIEKQKADFALRTKQEQAPRQVVDTRTGETREIPVDPGTEQAEAVRTEIAYQNALAEVQRQRTQEKREVVGDGTQEQGNREAVQGAQRTEAAQTDVTKDQQNPDR